MSRLISILTAASLILVGTPTEAKAVPVVYVQERVGGWFDPAVRQAIELLDQHTGSDLRLVTNCPATADRCFRFERKRMACCHGLTRHYQSDRDSAYIYLNPDYSASYPMSARVTLAAHELGHAFGLGHGPRSSVMYVYAPENGWATRTFSLSEQAYLGLR